MKYIDNFEDYTEPIFKVGDYVKIVDKISYWESLPYKILDISIGTATYRNEDKGKFYVYLLDMESNGDVWRKEDILRLVPKYELDAHKYNV